MEHGRGPGLAPTDFARLWRGIGWGGLAGIGGGAVAVDGNERHHPDAVLAAAPLPAQRSPSVIGEDVLARPDVGFRDAFGHEAGENGCPVAKRLPAGGAGQRLLLHLLSRFTRVHGKQPPNRDETGWKDGRNVRPRESGRRYPARSPRSQRQLAISPTSMACSIARRLLLWVWASLT